MSLPLLPISIMALLPFVVVTSRVFFQRDFLIYVGVYIVVSMGIGEFGILLYFHLESHQFSKFYLMKIFQGEFS